MSTRRGRRSGVRRGPRPSPAPGPVAGTTSYRGATSAGRIERLAAPLLAGPFLFSLWAVLPSSPPYEGKRGLTGAPLRGYILKDLRTSKDAGPPSPGKREAFSPSREAFPGLPVDSSSGPGLQVMSGSCQQGTPVRGPRRRRERSSEGASLAPSAKSLRDLSDASDLSEGSRRSNGSSPRSCPAPQCVGSSRCGHLALVTRPLCPPSPSARAMLGTWSFGHPPPSHVVPPRARGSPSLSFLFLGLGQRRRGCWEPS